MDENKKFIHLEDLGIYQLARRLSGIASKISNRISYLGKKVWGDLMSEPIDCVGAIIAEVYGIYYYLGKMRFYSIDRASLSEGKNYWLDLGLERKIFDQDVWDERRMIYKHLQIKLSNTISKTYESKKGGSNESL